jgi:hypothetical protein
MPTYIHSLVQYTDDNKSGFRKPIKYNMRANQIFEIAVSDIDRTP